MIPSLDQSADQAASPSVGVTHSAAATAAAPRARSGVPPLGKLPLKSTVKPGVPKNRIAEAARPKKATKEEHKARVTFTVKLLIEGRHKSWIKNYFRTQYGVSGWTAERYMRLARNRLVAATQVPKDELIAQSFGFYMDVLGDQKADRKHKLAARKAADDLLGLQAPKKIAPVMPDGDKPYELVVKSMSDEELEAIATVEQIAERHSSLATGTAGSSEN